MSVAGGMLGLGLLLCIQMLTSLSQDLVCCVNLAPCPAPTLSPTNVLWLIKVANSLQLGRREVGGAKIPGFGVPGRDYERARRGGSRKWPWVTWTMRMWPCRQMKQRQQKPVTGHDTHWGPRHRSRQNSSQG